MRSRRAIGGAALAVIAVAGCGTDLHPGAAAVVDGTTISQGEVGDLTSAFCTSIEQQRTSSGRSQPTTSIAELKRNLTGSLIQFQLTQDAADELGLSVSDAAVADFLKQQQVSVSESLPDDDQQLIEDFFDQAARNQLLLALIGAHQKDPSVTTIDQVTSDETQAGTTYMQKYAADHDVTVNPSYGTWGDQGLGLSSGSLSAAVSDQAKAFLQPPAQGETPDLPASQLCG